MALFKILSKKEIEENFDYYGSLFGIPCYIGNIYSEAPTIEPRNFIPDWALDVAQPIYFFIEGLLNWDNPEYEPIFKIRLDRPIKPNAGEICQCEECRNEKTKPN